jgi:DNA repair protein RadD
MWKGFPQIREGAEADCDHQTDAWYPMILLRDYQEQGEADIRQAFREGYISVLYQISTGGGKTTIFSSIALSAIRRDKIVRILCHRIELVDQIVSRLREFDLQPDIIASSHDDKGRGRRNRTVGPLSVASLQTLVRRLGQYRDPTLFIVDEAHHCVEGNTYSKILTASPAARVLGVTATPCRTDMRGLGNHFQVLVRGPTEQSLIERGFLVPTRIFAPKLVDTSGLHVRMGDVAADEADALIDKPAVIGDAFSHYMQHTPYQKAIVFATSIKNAENVAARFREGGVPALSLDGNTDRTVRRMAVSDYRDGKILTLTSCQLFDEGFDIPDARVGIMLAPTKSLRRYRQQKGRTMRPAPEKDYAYLLDCVRNCENPGFELAQGETDDWQLEVDSSRAKRKPPPGVRVCTKCFAASSARATQCVNCKKPFETRPRKIEERDGELTEVTADELAAKRLKRAAAFEQHNADTVEKLVEVFRKRGYKGDLAGRARHVLAARAAKKSVGGSHE